MNVEQWVELFRISGLDEATMHLWHENFEQRHPEAHQRFLEWLGMSSERIDEVRRRSQQRSW